MLFRIHTDAPLQDAPLSTGMLPYRVLRYPYGMLRYPSRMLPTGMLRYRYRVV